MFCGFVVFNNLSMRFNVVGIYQLLKVMTTPVIVVLQYVCYGVKLPFWQTVSLLPVCVGVILATVTYIEFKFWGMVFGLLGILSTSVYQIWVKTEQKRLDTTAPQLLHN